MLSMVLEPTQNMSHPLIINSGVWNPDNIDRPLGIAVLALEHLIKLHYSDMSQVRLVEVGPICVIDSLKQEHIAPISEISKRNPSVKCVAYGLEKPSTQEERDKTLGKVEMVYGPLTIEKNITVLLDILFEKLDGRPNIIYGQHVFENSPCEFRDLPHGSYKPFEKASEIVETGGFIVVDNYNGKLHKVGKCDSRTYTSQMEHKFSYMYSKDEGIHVYRKL